MEDAMREKLVSIHGERFVDESLTRIRTLLEELFGEELGGRNYLYLADALGRYLDSLSDEAIQRAATFDPEEPYAHLDGKLFAICYPDNVYDDLKPTLNTLGQTLERYFPSVNGIHILPERLMSHWDLWPQDLMELLSPEGAVQLVSHLQQTGILSKERCVSDAFEETKVQLEADDLPRWHSMNRKNALTEENVFVEGVLKLLGSAYNSHFNDGGFSQKTRVIVDPRFGTTEDVRQLSKHYAVMLDFVVNHLDIENDTLEAFRRGEDDGAAFIVISPEEYGRLKRDHIIEKTFRPRPFPLFTGMRKYAADATADLRGQAGEMNRRFEFEGLTPLDTRLVAFLSIYFKVRNDQGLTATDRRAFSAFRQFMKQNGIEESHLLKDSDIQPQQKVFAGTASESMAGLLDSVGVDARYAEVFGKYDDEVFGEKFFVYTTFSESQPDINPTSEAGFRMIVDDLFHLLSSGELAMMRMDAIKYLWKEIGKRNFDMEEGNRLIEVIRLLLRLAAPRVLALDEVNSPDPVVYEMGRDGGFAYLFGQVNTVPAAFNSGSLGPIQRFYDTMKQKCPQNLVLFVMLSTHDGRSVQGLGVQRTDGHVSIAQFYDIMEVIEKRGGKPKFRSVPVGEIPSDTCRKVCLEAGLDEQKVHTLFTDESLRQGEALRLKNPQISQPELLQALSEEVDRDPGELVTIPAVDYFLQWIAEGRTPYELCCTSRSSFSPVGPDGKPLSPEEEAARLALAQLYVLTLGQVVPAIYFNDLLGLENDSVSFGLTGKPRDLNRHKNYLPETGLDSTDDPFSSTYIGLINRILDARIKDRAFYPGRQEFEFRALTDCVFLNHPFARGRHSFICGNIGSAAQRITLDLNTLAGLTAEEIGLIAKQGLVDALSTSVYGTATGDRVDLKLPGYGAVWLQPA
jgi:hypothetical protein